MKKLDGQRDLCRNWFFSQKVTQEEALATEMRAEQWERVSLPHDWSIFYDFDYQSPAQNEGGQLNGGTAWYRTSFFVEEDVSQKSIRLCFDGVYMDSQVFVNGRLVGRYPSGYTPFSYDVTDYLRNDGQENILVVFVQNQQPSSRWYSGSGIYRKVYLLIQEQIHISLNGIKISSPHLMKQQDSKVETVFTTDLVNASPDVAHLSIKQWIEDQEGREITSHFQREEIEVQPYQLMTIKGGLFVSQPHLWDVWSSNPAIYCLKTFLYREGVLVDEREDWFGYRDLSWDSDHGFFLNGKSLKLHGVCLHHDHGALGAVENEKALYRRLTQMKEMGANAIRTSHNPASPELLKLAAQLGLLVQEEAFDTWYGGKKTYDYGRFFEEKASHPDAKVDETWSDFDLRSMIERGRNNPAIFMWSIGNEISEANGDKKSLETVKRLVKLVKELDDSRYVTMGIDAFRFGDGSGGHELIADELDAVGLNYAEDNYEYLRQQHPDWLMYGSETSSATRTRGSYFRPQKEWIGHNKALRKFEQSDYGNDRVPWGKTASASWIFDRNHPGYAGQFIWTGVDYIGEPTPWHNQNNTPVKSSYFGLVDTAGIPKNDYYLYQSQWRNREEYPMVHLLPHWNWEKVSLRQQVVDQQGRISVRAYSNASCVELFLNGESQGIQQFHECLTTDGRSYQEGKNPEELYLEWLLSYKPGELLAVAYDENDMEIARQSIKTAGKAAAIRLLPEENQIKADGRDLAYIRYQIVDEEGNLVPTANHQIQFELNGQGQIVGVDNGQQSSRERYKAQTDGTWQRRAFHGQGMVIVESKEESGMITLTASSRGLQSAQVLISTGTFLTSPSQPIALTIKLGAERFIEDAILPIRCLLSYPDGLEQEISSQALDWTCSGTGWATISNHTLQLRQAGKVQLTAMYEGLSWTAEFMIEKSENQPKPVRIRPLFLYTNKHQQPQLPETVLVEMAHGFPKRYPVSWEAIPEIDLSFYHRFTISGKVPSVKELALADIVVEGIVAAENTSLVTLVGQVPKLPEQVAVFLSNGKMGSALVTWEKVPVDLYEQAGAFHLKGKIKESDLEALLHIRVSEDGVLDENISNQWTGSALPLAFASASQRKHGAAFLNDRHLSFSSNDQKSWVSPVAVREAFVGVIFGDAGSLSKSLVDNVSVAFNNWSDERLENLLLEYYTGPQPELPQVADAMEKEKIALANGANWKAVANLVVHKPEKEDQMVRFNFAPVHCYALRLRFKHLQEPIAISELQVFSKKALPYSEAEVSVVVKGKELDSQQLIYEFEDALLPSDVTICQNCGASATIVPLTASDGLRILVRAEDGRLLREHCLVRKEKK